MIYLLLVLRRTPKGLGRPVLEEAEDFIFVVALTFLQEAGVLDVEHLAGGIEDHEDGEAKAAAVVQASHQGGGLLLLGFASRLARMIVHVDILEVVADDLADGGVVGCEVGEA